tara:strand:+ start:240 stop:380 length:141 start_codon:yes stop_codon:yes gene_type:complete
VIGRTVLKLHHASSVKNIGSDVTDELRRLESGKHNGKESECEMKGR